MTENASTTTQLLLINQRLDSIEHYFDWTIGGVAIIVTAFLALFVIIQAFYVRKIQREELEKIESDLKTKLNLTLDEKALQLQSIIEENIKDLERKIVEVKTQAEADIARHFAFVASNSDLPVKELFWWIKAASHYSFLEEDELIQTSLAAARDTFPKMAAGDNQKLWKEVSKIKMNLNLITDKYETEKDYISKKIGETIESIGKKQE